MSEDSLSETSMEDLDRAELTAKSLASVCMNRVTQGLYGIESDKQIDALHMYDWLPEEWSKNYNIMHQWKLLMYDTKIRILTRILHILGTTQNIQLQLKVVKALRFLGREDNIVDVMMNAGGMPLIISLLLSCDETLFSESLALMKRLVRSGNYGDERELMIDCGLIDVLCLAFVNCQNAETLENIADFWFDFFHCFNRHDRAPERQVSQVCRVLNFMLHQKEGVLADESVQVACLRKVHWHDCEPYWHSFVDTGLIITLTEILVSTEHSKEDLKEQALIILCFFSAEEPAAKQMIDKGILEGISLQDAENKVDLFTNMLTLQVLRDRGKPYVESLKSWSQWVSSDEIKKQCIRSGVIDYVLKLMENPDKTEDLEYSGVGFLGNVFQPNPKGIPKEYSERVIPILVKSLKSGREYIVRTALTGLAGMTATYDGDQFDNVDKLLECGVLPQIVGLVGSRESSMNGGALLLASNLAFSGKKAVVRTLLDAGLMANASSALNRAVSYHIDHYSAEVAKLVMWITNAGFGNDVGSEKIKSLGVLIKKMWKDQRNPKEKNAREMQIQTYNEEDLIDFGSHILDTIDFNEMRTLLGMNHFGIFLFTYPEESDPLRDKKLNFLVKTVDTIHKLGYRRMYCHYHYHLNEALKRTTSEEIKSVLPYVLSGLCSRPEHEELMLPSDKESKKSENTEAATSQACGLL